MNHHRYTDQIIGFAFGEVLADSGCVLTDLYVRTRQGQSEVEGKRGGLVVHVSILRGLLENAATLLAEMVETGANHDILPPARMPIPAWDGGPTLRSTNGQLVLCQGFGVTEAVPEAGAIGALIEASGLGEGSRISQGEYLIPYQVLLNLLEALPKALSRLEDRAAEPTLINGARRARHTLGLPSRHEIPRPN